MRLTNDQVEIWWANCGGEMGRFLMILASYLIAQTGSAAWQGKVHNIEGKKVSVATKDASSPKSGATLYALREGKEVARLRIKTGFHSKIEATLMSGSTKVGDIVTDTKPSGTEGFNAAKTTELLQFVRTVPDSDDPMYLKASKKVRQLIISGANPNAKYDTGEDLAMFAFEKNMLNVFIALHENGADFSGLDSEGRNILWRMIENKDPYAYDPAALDQYLELLAKSQIDWLTRNRAGETVFDVARRERKWKRLIYYQKSRGTTPDTAMPGAAGE